MAVTDAETTDSTTAEPYVAVIYFHGMGSQRRYEETSRLIDSLDAYLTNTREKGMEDLGLFRRIEPKVEKSHLQDASDVVYIGGSYYPPTEDEGRKVRFYESYWAPMMAGASSASDVAKWLVTQVKRPWKTLRAPWRKRQRLRRATLVGLLGQPHRWPEGVEHDDFEQLAQHYDVFYKKDLKREYPKGSFDEFLRFIDKRKNVDEAAQGRQIALAKVWRARYTISELRNSFLLLTILLALLLSGGLALCAALALFGSLIRLAIVALGQSATEALSQVSLESVGATLLVLAVTAYIFGKMRRFLRDFMGDVEAWSTYEETNAKHQRRRQVIAAGKDVVRHVLADPACERAVIIAHSLGTSIAHDTILALNRANTARDEGDRVPLERISHFVTLASPIDKVNYFFENSGSAFHRYTRVVEKLRGDILSAPFRHNNRPHCHWINFWDEADVISGALHSPSGMNNLDHQVDNVHVSSLGFPHPGDSHSAYFGNRTVVKALGDIIFHDRHRFPAADDEDDDFTKTLLGPGQDTGRHRLTFPAFVLSPWVALFALLAAFAGANTMSWVLFAVLGCLAGWICWRSFRTGGKRQRDPL